MINWHTILVLWALTCFHQTCAQSGQKSYRSFAIELQELVWIRDFEEPGMSSEKLRSRLLNQLENAHVFHAVTCDESGNIEALINGMEVDYRRFGVPYFRTSDKISNARWSGKLAIGFSDGHYRVIVYNLEYRSVLKGQRWVPKTMLRPARKDSRGMASQWYLNSLRSGFKKSSLKDLDIMNIALVDFFRLIPDWNLSPMTGGAEEASF